MHKISLVKNIFKTFEDKFAGTIEKIRGVHLTVGLLINVQSILMQNAFKAVLADQHHYNKTSLQVKVLLVVDLEVVNYFKYKR
jgi:hydrogenase nickel incorporation protein HypA/HybF